MIACSQLALCSGKHPGGDRCLQVSWKATDVQLQDMEDHPPKINAMIYKQTTSAVQCKDDMHRKVQITTSATLICAFDKLILGTGNIRPVDSSIVVGNAFELSDSSTRSQYNSWNLSCLHAAHSA